MAKYRCALGAIPILSDRQCAMMEREAYEAQGRGYGLLPRDYNDTPLGSFCAPFSMPTIPENEWRARIDEQKRTKGRLSDLIAHHKLTVKNQGKTPLCWAFGITFAYEISILQRYGTKVRLSPASIAQRIQGVNGMSGGYGPDAIKEIGKDGIAPSSLWPDNKYGRQYDNAESKAARKKYILNEWLDLKPRNFDQLATCLLMLNATGTGFNWWRHLVCAVDLVYEGGDYGILIGNSWGTGYGENGYSVIMLPKANPDSANAPQVGLYQPSEPTGNRRVIPVGKV